MQEAFRHPSQFKALAAHLEGQTVDWASVFAGYRSQVDFPGAIIWRELLTAFPDAKVLHTVRDPERWYDSTASTIYLLSAAAAPWVRRALPMVGRAFVVNDAMIWDGLFEGRFEDRSRAIEIFEARTEEVKATVPADRLLVFDVKDGWEPLCAFLDVPVPSGPFPHENDRQIMQRLLFATRSISYGLPLAAGLAGLTRLTRSLGKRGQD